MARPRKYIRVTEAPDGSLSLANNRQGREVHGLSFNASNKTYYTIDDPTGKRQYLGRDLDDAVDAVERPQIRQEVWDALDIDVEIHRTTDNLIGGEPGKEAGHRPDKKALEAILEFARQAGSKVVSPSRQRLSDCLRTWVDWVTNDGATPKTANVKDNEKRFRSFTRCVGNLPISAIT